MKNSSNQSIKLSNYKRKQSFTEKIKEEFKIDWIICLTYGLTVGLTRSGTSDMFINFVFSGHRVAGQDIFDGRNSAEDRRRHRWSQSWLEFVQHVHYLLFFHLFTLCWLIRALLGCFPCKASFWHFLASFWDFSSHKLSKLVSVVTWQSQLLCHFQRKFKSEKGSKSNLCSHIPATLKKQTWR